MPRRGSVDFLDLLGREKEARASFDKATEAAKGYADVLRENFLQVLEVLESFRESKSKNFVLRQSVLDTLDQVRQQEPVPPSRLQPRIPENLETICLQCLEK